MNWDAIRGIYYNTQTQTGMLQELNVKPGDVVECVNPRSGIIFTARRHYTVNQDSEITSDIGACCGTTTSKFRIISRAPGDTPKLWRDMTDEERGELLLAHHRGEVIEYWNGMYWVPPLDGLPSWFPVDAYRIKTDEPVRETVELYGKYPTEHRWGKFRIGDTHRITFDTINGAPDPDTIKMERI